jgi:hypothetical protein
VESHPFGFAQGRLLRKRPRKDGAPGHRDAVCSGFPIAPVTRIGFAMFVLIRTTQPFQ